MGGQAMTRGLLSCNTCGMLYSVLDGAGRCLQCATRWMRLTGETPSHPQLMQEASEAANEWQKKSRKCKHCGNLVSNQEFPLQSTVTYTRRRWCRTCIETFPPTRGSYLQPLYDSHGPGRPRIVSSADGRTCTGCRTFKPWDAYSILTKGHHGRNSRCKACEIARSAGRKR